MKHQDHVFSSKVALITGGSRGIGRAISLELARHGCKIAFCYKTDQQTATALLREVENLGSNALAIQKDIRQFNNAKGVVGEALEAFGAIDFLVNCAGVLRDRPLYLMGEDDWNDVLETNLSGTFNLTRCVVTSMMKRGKGKILNIASTAGLSGVPGQTNYCASKAGIIGFTRALAREVASFNVKVNAIAPGFIETDVISGLPESRRKDFLKKIPLGRFGQPSEVASLALYLLSDEAEYITGQVFVVDGGLTS